MCTHQDGKGQWTATIKEVKDTPTHGDFSAICKQCGDDISGVMFEHSF